MGPLQDMWNVFLWNSIHVDVVSLYSNSLKKSFIFYSNIVWDHYSYPALCDRTNTTFARL